MTSVFKSRLKKYREFKESQFGMKVVFIGEKFEEAYPSYGERETEYIRVKVDQEEFSKCQK